MNIKDFGGDVEAGKVTAIIAITEDGPVVVPAIIDKDGNVTLLVRIEGDVILQAVYVEADFTDTDFGDEYKHVAEEIARAASLMIVEGRGEGTFDPSSEVTGQEALTMFMRAVGIPVQFDSAMETAAEHHLGDGVAEPDEPMTRIGTAALIVDVLKDLGMLENVPTAEEAKALLSGFTDLGDLSEEEMINLAICVELGIFRGAGDGHMNPHDELLRSQMASLAVRLQDAILGA